MVNRPSDAVFASYVHTSSTDSQQGVFPNRGVVIFVSELKIIRRQALNFFEVVNGRLQELSLDPGKKITRGEQCCFFVQLDRVAVKCCQDF